MAKLFSKGKKTNESPRTSIKTPELATASEKLEIQPSLEKLTAFLKGSYKGGFAQLFECASQVINADKSNPSSEELLVNTLVKFIKECTAPKPAAQPEPEKAQALLNEKESASFSKIARRIAGESFPLLGQASDSGLVWEIGLCLSEKSLDFLSDSITALIAGGSRETEEYAMLVASIISKNAKMSQKSMHVIATAALQTARNTMPGDLAMVIKLKDIAKNVGKNSTSEETLDIVNQLRTATEMLEKKSEVK